jgi:hypothetical protein
VDQRGPAIDQRGRLLTCVAQLLTCVAQLLTCVAQLLTCVAQLLTCVILPSGYSVHNFELDPIWIPLRDDSRFQKFTKSER